MKEIEKVWDQPKLPRKEEKDNADSNILGNMQDVFDELDDSLVKINTLISIKMPKEYVW